MQLVDRIKESCSSRVWQQGEKLAQRVQGDTKQTDEVSFRLPLPGRKSVVTVAFYPTTEEWECSCTSKSDVCSHVAACAVALKTETNLFSGIATGRVGYVFGRQAANPVLNRVVFVEGERVPLNASIGRILTGHSVGPAMEPTQWDLQIDHILGPNHRGRLQVEKLGELLKLLEESDCPVFVEETQVQVDAEPILPKAVVEDVDEDVVLALYADKSVTEVIGNGLVLCGELLRPLGEAHLTGMRLEHLPAKVSYGSRIELLMTEVLPALRQLIPVKVTSARLPETTQKVRPRIMMDVQHEHHTLRVTPQIVYGDPPQARIEEGRLVHIAGAVPVRDVEEEKRLMMELRDELNIVPGRTVEYERAEAIRFANRLQAWQSGDTSLASFSQLNTTEGPPLEPVIEVDGDEFHIEFEVHPLDGKTKGAGGRRQRVDAATVMSAWRDGLQLVPLTGGGWASLPSDFLEKHGHRVADLLAARDAAGKVQKFALTDLAKLCEHLNKPSPPGLKHLAPLFQEFTSLPDSTLPQDLTADLREYQRIGVNWLSFLKRAELGAILADDMGLGKTLQTLCAIEGKTLVVCPRSVLYNWKAEIEKFRPSMKAQIYHGPKRKINKGTQVVLTTYSLMRIDNDKLCETEWDMVVLDEAQAIKNPDSQVARAAYKIPAKFRVALSGTPVENRLEELWSQFHFCNRGLLGGRNDFRERYGRPITRGEKDAAKRLRDRIRPFVLRRLKRDVAPELPARTEMVLHCELSESERLVYDTIRAAARKDILEHLQKGGSVMLALEALLRLRQASCHTGLVPGEEAEQSSKLNLLRDTLESAIADGHKSLVFSQWTSLLDRIEPVLKEAGIAYVRLDGSTGNRQKVVDAFQAEDGPPVMLISLKAGGTGLNLTAADHVFLCDPWWNPAVEDQAADRAHRIGQDKPVMVYRLVAQDTVEERILELQAKKRELADAALGDAHQAASLTRDDLLALLA